MLITPTTPSKILFATNSLITPQTPFVYSLLKLDCKIELLLKQKTVKNKIDTTKINTYCQQEKERVIYINLN